MVGSETFGTQVLIRLLPQVEIHALKTTTRLLETLLFYGKMQVLLGKEISASGMHAARVRFKLAHKRCNKNEDNLRAAAFVAKLRYGKVILF